jgi:hypothetical protein
MDRDILYKEGATIRLEGYTNADWAGNLSKRQSTSSFVFSLGSEVVSWSSKKQPIVILLITEAKYKGAAIATCEVIWLKRLLKDLKKPVNKPI